MAGPAQDLDDDDDVIAQINIIPFVDISLVLLIIFLCTSSLIAKAAFPVDLPRAAAAGEAVESTANIVVASDGSFFLNGNSVTAEGLRDGIAKAAKADPKVRAAIAADKSVQYEHLIEAIDLVRQGGVSTFALNVERGTPARP